MFVTSYSMLLVYLLVSSFAYAIPTLQQDHVTLLNRFNYSHRRAEILQSLFDNGVIRHDRIEVQDDPAITTVFVSPDTEENVECDVEDGSQCFRFRVHSQSPDQKLVKARLLVYLLPDPKSSDLQLDITISLPASHYRARQTLASTTTYVQKGWTEINIPITPDNVKLFSDLWTFVEVTCQQTLSGHVDIGPSLKPTLSLAYATKNRARRQAWWDPSAVCDTNTDCCLRGLNITINVDDIIQASTTFTANYCTGTCLTPSYNGDVTARSRLLLQESQSHNAAFAPPLCCVPQSFYSLSIAIFENGQIQEVTIPDMTATSCGCVYL